MQNFSPSFISTGLKETSSPITFQKFHMKNIKQQTSVHTFQFQTHLMDLNDISYRRSEVKSSTFHFTSMYKKY